MKNINLKNKRLLITIAVSLVALFLLTLLIKFIPSLIIVGLINLIIAFYFQEGKFNFKEFFKSCLLTCFIGGIFTLSLGITFVIYIANTVDEFNPETLKNVVPTIVYDSKGNELAKLGSEMRTTVSYDEISQAMVEALIATEDSRFFQHSGFDFPRFLVASINQVLGNGGGGASTLTMQLSKQTQTSTEDAGIEGVIRKFNDIYLSIFEIERRYTKEDIIEFYLNFNSLGGMIYGVEQASQTFFNKPASELSIAEAAMIAGMYQAPTSYNPYNYPEACETRRQTVLYLMYKHEYINDEEYEVAKKLTVDIIVKEKQEETSTTIEHQDFVDTVVAEVIERTGNNPYVVPMYIYTTIDTDIQTHMNGVMSGETYSWTDENIQAGSVVLDVHTGALVAVGAGHNRIAGDWNYAIQNSRHIGSTAKAIYDYAPAFEFLNWDTYHPLADEPTNYSGGISVSNWDKTYNGFTTLHDSLKYSRNTTSLKTFQAVSKSSIINMVTNMGLNPELEGGTLVESHSLGAYNGESPLTLAAAYAAFSNGGYYYEPHSFTSLTYIDTDEEYTVTPITKKVMSSETAYMVMKILEDTASHASGGTINGYNYGSKTGTSTIDYATKVALGLNGDTNDKWMASVNQDYAVTVWLGYKSNNKETYNINSFNIISSLFRSIASGAYTTKSTWTQPSGVVSVSVELGLPTATLPSANTPSSMTGTFLFKKGFEPTEVSTRFSTLNNVTSLNYNNSKLTWEAIDTPDFFDTEYLNELYDDMFNTDEYQQKHIESVITYNNENLGNIIYNIYEKEADNSLTLLGTTESTEFSYVSTSNTTFVVKATYSKFDTAISSGTELTIDKSDTVITSQLTGSSITEYNINDKITIDSDPVIVLENGTSNITNKANITYKIERKSDNKTITIDEINSNSVETYTITYTITYGDYKNTLTKIINITNKEG